MLCISLVDDETVQDDLEKEFLVYEGIHFLSFLIIRRGHFSSVNKNLTESV